MSLGHPSFPMMTGNLYLIYKWALMWLESLSLEWQRHAQWGKGNWPGSVYVVTTSAFLLSWLWSSECVSSIWSHHGPSFWGCSSVPGPWHMLQCAIGFNQQMQCCSLHSLCSTSEACYDSCCPEKAHQRVATSVLMCHPSIWHALSNKAVPWGSWPLCLWFQIC